MTLPAVLAPLFVHVALTFYLLLGMVLHRRQAVLDRKVKPGDVALRGGNPWPARAAQFGDAYMNAFELPLLFYVLTILAVITRQADILFVLLSWIYVLLRIVQAGIHTTSNVRKWRSLVWRAGAAVLCAMWIVFALRIYVLD